MIERRRISIANTEPVKPPTFEDAGHVSRVPAGLRRQSPELSDKYASVELNGPALRNIGHFARIAFALEPGQNVQADMNELSSFRDAYFFEYPDSELSEETPKFIISGNYVDDTIVQTNVDPYEEIVGVLGINDAPDYKRLIERGPWIYDGGDFRSHEYTLAVEGLKTCLYMRGDLPDSEIDFTPEFSLGVAVYRPSMQ